MRKFLIPVLTTLLVVMLTTPVTAEVMGSSAYVGNKTTFKILPTGCNTKAKARPLDTVLGFGEAGPFFGEWGMTLISSDLDMALFGPYIERKPNKELTMGLNSESFDEVLSFIAFFIETECNGEVTDAQWQAFEVSTGRGKISKNGETIKVKIDLNGKYTRDNGKIKKVRFKLKGKTKFDPDAQNPLFPG